jgi:hypothetical protein
MAKLHKVEMYVLDINKQYGTLRDTIEHINDRLELVSLHPFNIQSVDFEWDDEHKLNYTNKTHEDFSAVFGKENNNQNIDVSKINLCDSCRNCLPVCDSNYDDVVFGNGIGNDNIIECSKYDCAMIEQKHYDTLYAALNLACEHISKDKIHVDTDKYKSKNSLLGYFVIKANKFLNSK